MSHLHFLPNGKQSTPRGYIRGVAIEIEWITSFVYDGDGLFIAHLVAPHAETDFFYQFSPAFIPASTNAYTLDYILPEAYYWNNVFMDFRDLPTTMFIRASVEVEGFEIVLREPDYDVADPIRLELPAMPSTYWLR